MRISCALVTLALAIGPLPGCEKSELEDEVLTEATSDKSPFDRGRLADYVQAFQGNWVMRAPNKDEPVAWNVDGATITTYDGSEEHTAKFEVAAPCLTVVKKGNVTRYLKFVGGEKRKYAALAKSAGIVTAEGFVVCGSKHIHVKTDSGCTVWNRRRRSWNSTETNCSMDGNRVTLHTPASALQFSDSDRDQQLERVGDLLLDVGALDNEGNLRKPDLHNPNEYPTFEKAKSAIGE